MSDVPAPDIYRALTVKVSILDIDPLPLLRSKINRVHLLK